ncbi:hypothetical protein [Flagellimonas pacifica]|uniref:Lipoprotein n=1 Tax=Flagellimonas pacifica TaxID=1247520 RepID=A0A285MXS9_9FLAO|nr:hypothetical protein [Allomuricauda parva]SNZ00606.1 hypothetical protein SAMN06265377_2431 [Allomuricauda parva]
MKKYFFSKLRLSVLVLPLFFSSCQKEEQIDLSDNSYKSNLYNKDYIKEASLKEQLEYKIYHLSSLMQGVVKSGIDYNSMFYGKAKKDETGQLLLFRDIIQSNSVDNKNRIVSDSISFSLDAFEGLSEVLMNPTLEKLKDGDESNPIFLMSSYDETLEEQVVIGFEFDENGEIKMLDGYIQEEDIFSSASKDDHTQVFKIGVDDDCNCPGGGSSEGGTSENSSEWVKMEYIKIKDKKESWLEKADIKFEVATSGPGALRPGEYTTHCGQSIPSTCYYNGSFLAHCKNSEVNEKRKIDRDLGILQATGSTTCRV